MEFNHYSVLKTESIELLNVVAGGVYADGTAGGGGHSEEIAKHLSGSGSLILIDRDEVALAACKERLKNYSNITFVHNNFFNITAILEQQGKTGINGIILDLGVSSPQIDEAERGFSYRFDNAPLDMRMDAEEELTAEQIVNEYSREQIFKIIKDYGEEKFAYKIAHNITAARISGAITTAGQLKAIIDRSIPAKFRYADNPYKRTFQALRIAVNGELDGLAQAVKNCFNALKKGGRLAIITFHSLEDRIVKETFKEFSEGCVCKEYSPICVCGRKPQGKPITKKPISAKNSELEENQRSHSAKLRVIEKL